MAVSNDPLIQEWYEVYTEYTRYFLPAATDRVIDDNWCAHTNNLIAYYLATENLWKGFISFLRCQIDHYKRQNEHCKYIGMDKIVMQTRRPGQRYLP